MSERWQLDGWLDEVGYGLNRPWERRFQQAMQALLENEVGMAELISPEEERWPCAQDDKTEEEGWLLW